MADSKLNEQKKFIRWSLANGGNINDFTRALNAANNGSPIVARRIEFSLSNSSKEFRNKVLSNKGKELLRVT